MYRDFINRSVYAGDVEVKAIGFAMQPEFDRQYADIGRHFGERWLKTAGEEGVRELEWLYGVIPDPSRDSLEVRRERLLELKRRREPFTERWLHAELYRRTESDAITAKIENLALAIEVRAPFGAVGDAFIETRVVREVVPWLRGVIPANILLYVHHMVLPQEYHVTEYRADFMREGLSVHYTSDGEMPTDSLVYHAGMEVPNIGAVYTSDGEMPTDSLVYHAGMEVSNMGTVYVSDGEMPTDSVVHVAGMEVSVIATAYFGGGAMHTDA